MTAQVQQPLSQEKSVSSPAEVAGTSDSAVPGTIPFFNGFNASAAFTDQHDAASGYSWLVTPGVAYRFNENFSADAGVPIFMFIDIDQAFTRNKVTNYTFVANRGLVGDTSVSGHFEIHPNLLDYTFTGTLGLPTGDPGKGLGAGQVTYNFNNHFEHSFWRLSPDLETGIGDSSSLTNTAVHKSYLAVGLLAYFQVGSSVELPFHTTFEADMYEQLPLNRNTLYTTTGKGKKAITTSTTTGAAEDNGFTTTFDIPINTHTTLTGFYNRSLRDKDDTAGFTVSFLLRSPSKDEQASIDELVHGVK